jgi:hypothetical protein
MECWCLIQKSKLTPWGKVLEKVIVTLLAKKFLASYRTRGFITIFVRYESHQKSVVD